MFGADTHWNPTLCDEVEVDKFQRTCNQFQPSPERKQFLEIPWCSVNLYSPFLYQVRLATRQNAVSLRAGRNVTGPRIIFPKCDFFPGLLTGLYESVIPGGSSRIIQYWTIVCHMHALNYISLAFECWKIATEPIFINAWCECSQFGRLAPRLVHPLSGDYVFSG